MHPNFNPNAVRLQNTQESPNLFRDRLSTGSEFQHISPIPTLSIGSNDSHSQNTNEKSNPATLIRNTLSKDKQLYSAAIDSNNKQKNIVKETPSANAKDFYKRTGVQQQQQEEKYFESYDDSQSNNDMHTAIKFGYDNQYLSTNLVGQIKSIGAKGSMKDLKGGECTDFDLTAKEISSNKRFDKNKKNTIISGRTNHSPMDGAQSNSETVKWAFTNKDSQETQKKISIVNRESINTQDIISNSLKSHDSRQNQLLQSSSNQKVQAILKGKMLDFASIDPSIHQLESGILYSQGKFNQNLISNGTEDSDFTEENKVVSFLENDDEILLQSQRKLITNAQKYQKIVKKNGKSKYLPNLQQSVTQALKSLINNSQDCPFCYEQKIYDSSLQCSKLDGPKTSVEIIKENLERKYLTSREYYNVKIINDIIYNEQTHIVSVFKDYLIYDDISEFLKRFYLRTESTQRLPKMFEFYEKYSKVFPNYVILPENKYLFKNIEKKQRIIDEKQRFLREQQEKQNNPKEFQLGNSAERKNKHKDRFSSQQQNSSNMSYMSNNKMFDTQFINSVANIKASGFIEQSSIMTNKMNSSKLQEHLQNSSILIHQQLQQNMENAKKKKKRGLEELDFDELISKFIAKDTESNIQQSTILLQSQIEENKPQQNEKKETKETQKRVYDYKEQRPVEKQQQPKNMIVNEQMPQQLEVNNKRLSSGSQKNHLDKKPVDAQALQTKEGKILNYNFINIKFNDNNFQFSDTVSNFNQITNNENYYVSKDKNQQKMIGPVEQNQLVANAGSRSGSLQRNQSKQNLHQNIQNKIIEQNPQTPLKGSTNNEINTPGSGNQQRKTGNVQTKYFKKKDEVLKVQQPSSKDDVPSNLMQTQNNRSSSSQQKSDLQITSSPLNQYGQRQKAQTQAINTLKNTDAIVSRELSKEKRREVQPQVQQVANQKQYPIQPNNQMFKNEFIMNIANRTNEQQQNAQAYDYNTLQTNVRSIERLRNIEDEIEKDFSKYVNEYGLTKTAFAKAVNQIREKQLKITGQLPNNIQSQPSTTRQVRLASNSNEKKRFSSNNGRSGSTSQNRKGSNTRAQKQIPQETANELYMNTNSVRADSQKQIRSVRTKTTHLSSQNSSSCFQRSGKLSPDKNYIVTNQFQNPITNATLNQTPSQTYLTLKQQPIKQQKGIKIKFPQGQKENVFTGQQQQQQNTSQNQTPKRIKLQKTKSTSNIPMCFSSRVALQQPMHTQRGRGGPEMIINDELSQQLSSNNIMGQNVRASQNVFDQSQPWGPQGVFQSNSCVGTYATTSILNSPLSFKGQPYEQVLNQQQRQSSKGRQSSRNGNSSQHQSQKSINGNHQRASSGNNLLQVSNSKIKKADKRMSAGSNLSKKVAQNIGAGGASSIHHQQTNSNFQQQILQLLMSYQNQPGENDTTIQSNQMNQFQSTLKSMNMNNTHSMKDLKSVKQPTLMKDIQIIKSKSKNIQGQPNTQNTLNTQRQTQGSIIMLNQNFKKSAKSGKNTVRLDSKKRPQQNIANPYNETNNMTGQYSQMQMTGNEVSSRLVNMLGTGSLGDQTSIASQAENARKILSYSKSQESLDLIKFAQRAAMEQHQQQQQQQQYVMNNQSLNQQMQNFPSTKFLQNLRPQESTMAMSKIKLVPSQNQVLQSARNLQQQYDSNSLSQYRTGSDYEIQNITAGQKSQGPTNIIIGSNFDRPQSRRTSAKFNPSSTKNQQS